MKKSILLLPLWLFLGAALLRPAGLAAAEPVVHAILFYSPSCSHCHTVMDKHLPPIIEQYGEQFSIVVVDASTQGGGAMYNLTADHFGIPPAQRGVPMMAVGDKVLMGSAEIPQQLPGIIETGLANGGIDWPDIPELREVLQAEGFLAVEADTAAENAPAAPPPAPDPAPAADEVAVGLDEAAAAVANPTMTDLFARDPVGNSLSVIVLLGMVVSVLLVLRAVLQQNKQLASWPGWVIPLLVVAGAGIAFYMAFVEVTETAAICGPVGDCNTVQQSSYASIGPVPIGVLGLFGYLVIGLSWLLVQYGPVARRRFFTVTLWLLALGGTLFSIYLTFLEPFVIGATCAWCLSSAVVMGLLLWATSAPALQTMFVRDRYERR